ncbi:hypothetical protein KJ596_02195 [Patescibacteria group bacterium]|nr:hypothetical protein [Patescibacteria group bacterium]MBU1868196.1 hypothetical protein [Patescibacteria group bacterium]
MLVPIRERVDSLDRQVVESDPDMAFRPGNVILVDFSPVEVRHERDGRPGRETGPKFRVFGVYRAHRDKVPYAYILGGLMTRGFLFTAQES